jgi:hypothetical protein
VHARCAVLSCAVSEKGVWKGEGGGVQIRLQHGQWSRVRCGGRGACMRVGLCVPACMPAGVMRCGLGAVLRVAVLRAAGELLAASSIAVGFRVVGF